MKSKLILVIFLFSSGFMVKAQETNAGKTQVMLENQSRYSFSATVDTISKHALANGWKVLVTHDLQETMKKNGKEVMPVRVLEICNPGFAYQILSVDDSRNVSPMLPCRVAVYEKADGKTYVSRMNAPVFAGMIGGDAAKTIVGAFNAMEGFVDKVLN